ncbi:CHAT domain-containing protein [Rhizobium flavescens]|uniref:CHAT domain-containing protein n=1 Tax=Rhizobium flavescens TaxID=2607407 RepID=UPI00140E5F2D|nr:CHAT domain-containing protein [Rhizobium flavescens]
MAQLGTRTGSTKYVELALKANEGKPEIVASAVAALSKMYNGRLNEVDCLSSIDPEIRVLAAMQVTEPSKLDLSGLQIKIDTADPQVLKLALITVGLNRDVENLFDPKHSNGQIVKALGQYPDDIVRQYCVWSVIENERLSIADLGISFDTLEDEAPNVQAKLLQLGAEQIKDPRERHDVIYRGSFIENAEARCGLAKGLLANYYDGLEEVTINWFGTEDSREVKGLLAEHIARFSDECPPYSDKALAIVDEEPDLRDRVFLGAEQTSLYGLLKANESSNGTMDLFQNGSDLEAVLRGSPLIKKERKVIKALMLASSPTDQQPLRLDTEARDLREQLKLVQEPTVDVLLENRWAVRSNQLQMEVMNAKPQILHFSGHGDHGLLIFEDVGGKTTEVSGEAIAELVELNRSIECLLLNACYSESVARLAAPYLKAVIGCNSEIGDEAAVAFTRSFYRALAHGEPYDRAFRHAKNEVRINSGSGEADRYVMLP